MRSDRVASSVSDLLGQLRVAIKHGRSTNDILVKIGGLPASESPELWVNVIKENSEPDAFRRLCLQQFLWRHFPKGTPVSNFTRIGGCKSLFTTKTVENLAAAIGNVPIDREPNHGHVVYNPDFPGNTVTMVFFALSSNATAEDFLRTVSGEQQTPSIRITDYVIHSFARDADPFGPSTDSLQTARSQDEDLVGNITAAQIPRLISRMRKSHPDSNARNNAYMEAWNIPPTEDPALWEKVAGDASVDQGFRLIGFEMLLTRHIPKDTPFVQFARLIGKKDWFGRRVLHSGSGEQVADNWPRFFKAGKGNAVFQPEFCKESTLYVVLSREVSETELAKFLQGKETDASLLVSDFLLFVPDGTSRGARQSINHPDKSTN